MDCDPKSFITGVLLGAAVTYVSNNKEAAVCKAIDYYVDAKHAIMPYISRVLPSRSKPVEKAESDLDLEVGEVTVFQMGDTYTVGYGNKPGECNGYLKDFDHEPTEFDLLALRTAAPREQGELLSIVLVEPSELKDQVNTEDFRELLTRYAGPLGDFGGTMPKLADICLVDGVKKVIAENDDMEEFVLE